MPFAAKSEMVWYFIDVYIITRTLHGRLETDNRNFSSCVEKYFTLSRSFVKYFHSKRNFVSPRGNVISSINLINGLETFSFLSFLKFSKMYVTFGF